MNKPNTLWRDRMVLLLLCLCFFTGMTYAQGVNITGTVLDASDNIPIISATVVVEGTQKGTVTDFDGNFSLTGIAAKARVTVSYLGYKTQAFVVQSGKTNYVIKLKEDTEQLEEVVVVGYGTMRKKEVTGAVARVDAESIVQVSTPDVGSALQGQIAGVNVQASSGQPGSAANIQIRGISSVNGSNQPLYVVDGVPYDGDPGLSPHEIASIDVLKDAASAAIYGTRGSGGVILVTTKAGKEGDTKVSIDVNSGIQSITSGLSLIDASEYTYLNTLREQGKGEASNRVWSTLWNNSGQFANNSELLSVVERDNQPITNAAITVSGGRKDLTYSFVGNYFNQEGVVINSGYERFNMRANSTLRKNKWTFNLNLSGVYDQQETPAWGLYNEVYMNKSTSQQIDPDASLTNAGSSDANELQSVGNVLAKFKQTTNNGGKGFNGNFSINYDIMKGLSFNSRLGTGFKSNRITTVNPFFEIYDKDGELVVNANTRSKIREDFRNNINFSWENMLNYHYNKGKHDFKATAVLSYEQYDYESFFAQKFDLINNDIPSLGATTGDPLVGVGQGQWGQDKRTALIGMLGRVQYNYASRYMLSASVRRDGSSRFAKENRWGYFPSVSAGWNISEEAFFEPLKNTVNSFKLRGSYGTTGNQNFGDYAYAASISPEHDYAFVGSAGDELTYGSIQTHYANAEVKWETTKQSNIGIDLAFLQSKLTVTADIYQTDKEDMLFPLKVPPVAGTGTSGEVILNVGNMENKGFEFATAWRSRVAGINYWARGTVARNVNEITKMAGSNKRTPIGTISTPSNSAQDITFLCEGMEAGVFLMMPTAGVVNTDAKLIEYQKLRPTAQMGDLIYVDENKDGQLNADDLVECGSGAPEVELGLSYGLNFKGFDASMTWYSSIGNEIVNGSKVVSYQNSANRDLLYAWTPDNPTSTIPRYTGDKSHYNTLVNTDIWVEDGSYARLRNVTVGYTFSKPFVKKLHLSKLRLYVAADNILTLTKYDGYDPEVGNDGLSQRGLDNGNYPISAQVRGGIQLDF